ncbi:MAG: ABC transporter permease [Planctomycetota bacterium]|nr:ABC transporter permease [Planctomycetota bacterium]
MISSLRRRPPSFAIVQKELILRIRRIRSLLIQLIFASIVGIAMWISSVTVLQGNVIETRSPEDHALSLVMIYFTIQIIVLGLIVPSLGAVSITSEKQAKTWEPLISTDITPAQVVWGKLLGICGVLFYLLLLPAPILSMTMLFGGVSLGSIAFEYLVQFLAAIFIVSLGIASSAASKGTIRSLTQISLVTVPLTAMSLGFLWAEVYGNEMLLLDYLEQNTIPWQFWAWTLTGYLSVVGGSLMSASYTLSGVESARDVPVRVLIFTFVSLFFGLIVLTLWPELSQASVAFTGAKPVTMDGEFGFICSVLLLLIPLSLTRIAGSETKVPLRIAQMHQRGLRGTRIGLIFLPGGIRNLLYSCALLSIPLLSMVILMSYEGNTAQIGTGASTIVGTLSESDMFLMWQCSLFLWGVAVLALSWFFAQCGFSGIFSGALASGIHIAIGLIVMTAVELDWTDSKVLLLESLSPPVLMLRDSRNFPQISPQLWNQFNISMGISIVILLSLGVLMARRRGNPVWAVKRPDLDRLYVEIPEEVS